MKDKLSYWWEDDALSFDAILSDDKYIFFQYNISSNYYEII